MKNSIGKLFSSIAVCALLCAGFTAAIAAEDDGWLTCKDGLKVHSGASCYDHGGVLLSKSKSTPIDTRKGLAPNAKAASSSKKKTTTNSVERKTTATRSSTPTAKCNDGAMYYSKTRKGACASHGGVKHWY